MFCRSCGIANGDDAAFCANCGAALVGQASGSEQLQSHVVQAAQTTQADWASQPARYGQEPRGAQSFASAQAPQSAQASFAPVMYEQGCVSAAWHDIKGTSGWFKKMLLLGLVLMVPILNFFVAGYAIRWARSLSFGRRESMPQHVFEEGAFASGFFVQVLLALVWVVSFALAFVLSFVPFVGTLVALVLSVFLGMFANACIIRMAVTDRFGAAFGFSRVWSAYKKSLGSLFCVSVVPNLLVGLVVAGVVLLAAFVLMMVFGAGALSLGGMGLGYGYGLRGSAFSVGALIGILVCELLVGYVMLVAGVISQVLTYRALGHWAARVAPEWAAESYASAYAPAAVPATYGGFYGQPQPIEPTPIAAAPVPAVASPVSASVAPEAPAFSYDRDEGSGLVSSLSSACVPDDKGTTNLDVGCTPLCLEQPTLVLERANGERLVVSTFPATIGKGSASNVCISGNASISRVHARISQAGESLVVEDLGSTNKTFLNGDCLAEGELVILRDGDLLSLGDESLSVSLG